jgi:parallel beta-helix repeat protein
MLIRKSAVIVIAFFVLEGNSTLSAIQNKDDGSFPFTPNGTVIYVGGSGPGNYTRIQDAIDNASDGDTVFVFNGHYIESINVDKSICLMGENNRQTIIERNLSGPTVTITIGFVTVSNLNITWSNADKGGISLTEINQPVTIRNNYFYRNNHGIFIHYCNQNVTIENNTICCCKRNWSRGIYCVGGNPIIKNNDISQNWWGITFECSTGVAINNTIHDNAFSGIMSGGAAPIIANNRIFNNSMGIDSRAQDRPIIEQNIIYNNFEGIIYGGVGEQPECYPLISNNHLFCNIIGIEGFDYTTGVISNNTIVLNNYGVYCADSNPTMVDNYILLNRYIAIYAGENCDIHFNLIRNSEIGIETGTWSAPNVKNNTITNTVLGIDISDVSIMINENNIMNNSEYGIYYDYNYADVDATNNWWGASDGPSGLGPGSGDNIGVRNIDFTPWLTEKNPYAYPRMVFANQEPGQPAQPDGPTRGKIRTEYSYFTSVTDSENDLVAYGWDWDGDLVVDEWTRAYNSGEPGSMVHRWNRSGSFEIRVKAVDINGAESSWSDPLSVKIRFSLLALFMDFLKKMVEWLLPYHSHATPYL